MDDELSLETDWRQNPSVADFLADVIIWDQTQSRHLVRTSLARKFVTVEAQLEPDAIAITVLGGKVSVGRHGLHVRVQADGYALSHAVPTSASMTNAIEVCSGLGALGEGLEHHGFTVQVRNELRPAYTQLMYRQGYQSSVVGDIGSNHTIASIHHTYQGSALHAAGFPCQPWSLLGDRKQHQDDRGRTLLSILRSAYLLRAHSVLLECVKQARDDEFIRKVLVRWCRITGFNARETYLDLHTIWPSKRSRWWVLLSFGGSSPPTLEPLPVIDPAPCVEDVLVSFPEWPSDQMKQLKLDAYELRMFCSYGGLETNMVDMHQPLKTALHSLGNQMTGCPCGCRSWPMKLERFRNKDSILS